MDKTIQEICKPLIEGISDNWDADDGMDINHVLDLPTGKFVSTLYELDKDVLSWLVFFVSRRSLPCWEVSCKDARPRKIIKRLGEYLIFNKPIDWNYAESPTKSPHKDCRISDTQSASDAISQAAKYIHKKDKLQAIYCLSSADIAYDHVLTEDRFRGWLTSVAVPIACEKREMTIDEMESLREQVTIKPVQISQ